MADLSKVTLPSGNTYDIKDATARQQIETIKTLTASGVSYAGTTTTVLTDGSTTSTITVKDGTSTKTLAATDGMMVNYNNVMYCWNGTQWDQLGAAGALKALAYKDSVTGSVTPVGSVSAPSFTGTQTDISVTGTPAGTVSAPTFTGTKTTVTVSGTPAGTVSAPTFTGDVSEVSVSGTPSGTVKITPSTGTISEITGVGTLPAFTATVANETLTFGWSAGTLPTKANATVMTGASATFTGEEITATGTVTPSGTVSAPTFTGTSLKASADITPAGTISAPTFTGSSMTAIGKVTPAGTVSQPVFTGAASTVESK